MIEDIILKELLQRALENESFSLVGLLVVQGIMLWRQRKANKEITKSLKTICEHQDKQTKILQSLVLEVGQNTDYRKRNASQ